MTTALVFQPGNYTVNQDLAIDGISNFSMVKDDNSSVESKVEITCAGYANIYFRGVDHVHINGINVEYIGLDVSSVGQFVVRDCVFARYTQSAMQLHNSNVSVTSTLFTSNSIGSYQGMISLRIKSYLAVGGALSISSSNVTVTNSTIERNSAGAGGAVFANQHSNINISNTVFRENSVHCPDCLGSVMYTEGSCTVSVHNCSFQGNTAAGDGGVFAMTESTFTISSSTFANNSAERGGVIYAKSSNTIVIVDSQFIHNYASVSGGVVTEITAEVRISNCIFTGNKAGSYAGVMDAFFDPVYINGSKFTNNSAVKYGGVFVASYVDINTKNSEFYNNTGGLAGVMYAYGKAGAVFENCTLKHNAARLQGGAVFAHDSTIRTVISTFANNKAFSGGVMYIQANTMLNMNKTTIENNSAEQGVLYCIESTTVFSNMVILTGNQGSLFLHYSKMYFKENTLFVNNTPTPRSGVTASLHSEGGAITAFQSEIYFEGTSYFRHNRALNGGAILARASKLFISGNAYMTTNTARVSGGGIYLYQSELNCKGTSTLILLVNSALERGGGVYAISSIVSAEYNYDINTKSYNGSRIWFLNNTAGHAGGGICLEINAKINILNVNEYDSKRSFYTLQFKGNSAYYGGAVYVADNTNSVLCMSSSNKIHSTAAECFLQTLVIVIRRERGDNTTDSTLSKNLFNTLFLRNRAQSRGATLYGGLLDRCTLSPFVKKSTESDDSEMNENSTFSGAAYFKSMSVIADTDPVTISSDPVRVCFCRDGQPDCVYQPQPIKVKKGDSFTVALVAVDQVENTVAAVIHSTPKSNLSGLAEGQLFQSVSNICTNLTFNVFSPKDNEELVLYADGPCKDAELSQQKIEIKFDPCTCSIGFQPVVSADLATRCMCECDSNLMKIIGNLECDPQTETLDRQSNFWVAHINDSDYSRGGYLYHAHCPLDYCQPSSAGVKINLNTQDGADKQCVNNRRGLLCGTCKSSFSLSLGSSNCIICPTYWPALLVLTLLAAIVLGIALVAMLSILNMTVAVGTLNGIIFYANIVAASSSTFFPSSKPTFASVFIAWLNLDFGIEACFFKGMNAYWKTWLQLCFPLYVIFLVIVIIAVSEKSKRFSNFIGKRNPVATLATLILFSYAKLLHIVVTVLSSTVLVYPNGKRKTVWLPDATVDYFKGGHIALFVVAIFILLAGILYTLALFSWQWIVRFNESKYLKWSRNQKLSLFVETYHIPYTPMNRYWTGLLLLVRVVLYIASTANVSGDPKLNLLIIGSGIVGVLLLMKLVSAFSPIYMKWPIEYVEVISYVNLILLCIAMFFSQDDKMRAGVINFSVSITFLLLLGILFYHISIELICPRLPHKKRVNDDGPQEIQYGPLEKSQLTSTIVMGPVKRGDTKYNTELREALLEAEDESAQTY